MSEQSKIGNYKVLVCHDEFSEFSGYHRYLTFDNCSSIIQSEAFYDTNHKFLRDKTISDSYYYLIYDHLKRKEKYKNCLILGGGVGILSKLVSPLFSENPLNIEIDQTILEACKFFGTEEESFLLCDAVDYINNSNEKFDITIVDICSMTDKMLTAPPMLFREEKFINKLKSITKKRVYINYVSRDKNIFTKANEILHKKDLINRMLVIETNERT